MSWSTPSWPGPLARCCLNGVWTNQRDAEAQECVEHPGFLCDRHDDRRGLRCLLSLRWPESAGLSSPTILMEPPLTMTDCGLRGITGFRKPRVFEALVLPCAAFLAVIAGLPINHRAHWSPDYDQQRITSRRWALPSPAFPPASRLRRPPPAPRSGPACHQDPPSPGPGAARGLPA